MSTPTSSISSVAAQSKPVCWQVPVTATPRALLIAWVANTAYLVGQAVINDGGKVYVCITAGTSAASGGPAGTTADITDNTAHWSYVAAKATAFKGSLILQVLAASADPIRFSTSAALAPGGKEVPKGTDGTPIFYGNATEIFVYSTGTATASVSAYP